MASRDRGLARFNFRFQLQPYGLRTAPLCLLRFTTIDFVADDERKKDDFFPTE